MTPTTRALAEIQLLVDLTSDLGEGMSTTTRPAQDWGQLPAQTTTDPHGDPAGAGLGSVLLIALNGKSAGDRIRLHLKKQLVCLRLGQQVRLRCSSATRSPTPRRRASAATAARTRSSTSTTSSVRGSMVRSSATEARSSSPTNAIRDTATGRSAVIAARLRGRRDDAVVMRRAELISPHRVYRDRSLAN
jgi:hypothetical protein